MGELKGTFQYSKIVILVKSKSHSFSSLRQDWDFARLSLCLHLAALELGSGALSEFMGLPGSTQTGVQ